jgi:hypothetical protein
MDYEHIKERIFNAFQGKPHEDLRWFVESFLEHIENNWTHMDGYGTEDVLPVILALNKTLGSLATAGHIIQMDRELIKELEDDNEKLRNHPQIKHERLLDEALQRISRKKKETN